ncbi:MAG TPA: hypothetical protein VI451_00825, partial [Anaerolineales bacterium]|nr:hypothetical protein [Anaerolineales bacterium]
TASGSPTIHLEPTDLRSGSTWVSPLSICNGEGSGVRPRPGLTQTILAFLSVNPNATREQIFAHCSSHKEGSVKNALYDLIEEKKVIRTNEGTNGKQALYSLSSN